LQAHPFFESLDWENILQLTPPYTPPSTGVLTEALRDGYDDWLLDESDTAVPLQVGGMLRPSDVYAPGPRIQGDRGR
jgi:hypothetical protein